MNRITAIILVALLPVVGAQAALVGEYLFDGNLNNSAGSGYALSLTEGSSSYSSETVFGATRSLLSLTASQGLEMDASAIADPDVYTVVMDVRSIDVSSYNKLLSLDGGTIDDGLYIHSNDIELYSMNETDVDHDNVFVDTWIRVAITRSASGLSVYSGTPGNLVLSSSSASPTEATLGDTLLFFKDDTTTGLGENYDLSVASLWIYDEALSSEQISAIPEPASFALFGVVSVFGLFIRRRFLN